MRHVRHEGSPTARGVRARALGPAVLQVLASVSVGVSAPPASAGQEARARPSYTHASEVIQRARKPGAGLDELIGLAGELERASYGLGEPLDTDRILASTVTLCALAAKPERAEALRGILAEAAGQLESSERGDPDLALALAQGWPALLVGATGKELPLDERIAGLTFALEHAGAIDVADQRDTKGATLAEALHAQLAASGPAEHATETLERWLARFPDDLERRPFLLIRAADERRLQQAWNAAWADLHLAGEAVERVAAESGAHVALLQRRLASTRCQLELACGLVDQALESIERERAAIRDGANDAESRFSLLLDVSTVALVSPRLAVLERARTELAEALADAQTFAEQAGYREQLRARLAVLQDLLERIVPAEEPRAARLLEEALALPGLEPVDRAMVVLRLVALAKRSGDVEAADRWVSRLEPRNAGAPPLPHEYVAGAAAWRARIALARGAERTELERLAGDVRACYERFLSTWASRPERAGGLGDLAVGSRRLLLGVLIDLHLALRKDDAKGDEEAVIDLLLREQAVGSLARLLAAQPGTVAEVRSRLLRPGTGLLLYLPDDLATHLFCIERERIEHFKLPWRYVHEPALSALTGLLVASPARLSADERAAQQRAIEARAKELSERLLPAGVRERMRSWKGAYVVGAELLGGVPFECLRLDDQELGTRFALAYLPSIPVGLALAKERSPSRELRLLLVAAPAAGERHGAEELAAIPFGKSERELLTGGFQRATVLEGAQATFTGVLDALRKDQPHVLHFLVHGVSDLERELSGGLALSSSTDDADGRLWCEDILAADFRCPELVLLSACGSARGPRRLGDDGLAQLGGAFLARGGRCTVQAMNDIALAPTVRMMGTFGRRLGAGDSPAEALRAARAELVADPSFAHPFYAQSLRVVGLALEPLAP